MRFIYSIILAALGIIAPVNCYQRGPVTSLDEVVDYTIIADVSERSAYIIDTAAISWMHAVPSLHIEVRRGQCASAAHRARTGCMLLATTEDIIAMGCPIGSVGCTTRYPSDGSAVLRIVATLSVGDMLCVAGHEIGHALGIHGHGHRGQIMAERIDWQTPNVTCEDARMFWATRGVEMGDCRWR